MPERREIPVPQAIRGRVDLPDRRVQLDQQARKAMPERKDRPGRKATQVIPAPPELMARWVQRDLKVIRAQRARRATRGRQVRRETPD